MLSIGWIMFFKTLVVSAWVAIIEAWYSFRRRRAEQGIPLRMDKAGVYRPDDWTEKVETAVRLLGRCLMTITILNMIFWFAVWVYVKVY